MDTTQTIIGKELEHGQREIRVGDHVAYGAVSADGATYALGHAPTQADFDAVSRALDKMTYEQIAAAISIRALQNAEVSKE